MAGVAIRQVRRHDIEMRADEGDRPFGTNGVSEHEIAAILRVADVVDLSFPVLTNGSTCSPHYRPNLLGAEARLSVVNFVNAHNAPSYCRDAEKAFVAQLPICSEFKVPGSRLEVSSTVSRPPRLVSGSPQQVAASFCDRVRGLSVD
jgi:hypothetical protein